MPLFKEVISLRNINNEVISITEVGSTQENLDFMAIAKEIAETHNHTANKNKCVGIFIKNKYYDLKAITKEK